MITKISKFILFIFLIDTISNIKIGLNDEKKDSIEFKIGSPVEYDQNKNYFKFDYFSANKTIIVFALNNYKVDIYLTNPIKEKKKIEKIYYDNNFHEEGIQAILDYNGTYYLEIICHSYVCELGSRFNTYIYGGLMDTINFDKKLYFRDFTFHTSKSSYNKGYYGESEYKVNNLKEDKYVYFMSLFKDFKTYYPYDSKEEYFPLDPYEPLDINNTTIFEIINIDKNESVNNVKLYKFEKGMNYTIRIHCLRSYYIRFQEWEDDYYYADYIFFSYNT